MPVTATTTLPDVTVDDITPVDASSEDQLTVPRPSVTNNGSYRLRYRESGTDAWTDWGSVAHDGPDMSVTGLKDGERYDLAVRSETDYRTGAYAEISEVTLLPAPSAVTISQRVDGVTITWSANADNGTQLVERRIHGGWETIATVGPGIESFEDPDPAWYSVSEYRVTAETEHAMSTSGVDETVPIHPNEFRAELERGGEQTVIGPSDLISVGEITLEHTTPSAFSLRVAPDATNYQDYCLGDVRLFYGETRFFSGRLDDASTQRGVTTLKGEGQLVELEQDTTVTQYTNIPAQDATRDYVSNVPGEWTVHDPYVRTLYDALEIYDTEFDSFADIVTTDPTDPVVADVDEVRLAQTCWVREAETADSLAGSVVSSSDTDEIYSGAEAVELASIGDQLAIDVSPEYDVPGDEVDIRIRASLDSFSGTLEFRVDGTVVGEISYPDGQNVDDGLRWRGSRTLSVDLDDLTSGSAHSFEAELTNRFNGSVRVDCMAIFDRGARYNDNSQISYNYTWDNTVDTQFYTLSGPERYPERFPVPLDVNERAWHVAAVDLETAIDNTDTAQALRLSPNGSEWAEASNTQTLSADFDAAEIYGTDVHAELILSRYVSDSSTTPSSGDGGQTCSSLRLTATIDDLPLLEDYVTDADTWLANIQNLHERASARFVVDHQADGLVVESFRVGDPDLVQPDDWTTAGQDAVETDRVTSDYFNQIRAVPSDLSVDVSPLTLPDVGEIDRVGETIQESRTFDVETRDELRREARQALREGIAGDEFSGRINIVPTDIQPGYPYEPDEFNGSLTNAEQVTITVSDGDASGQISFGARRDLVARIQQRTRGGN